MGTYRVWATVVGTKYLGEFEAESKEAAEELALESASVSLCHQCTSECEDPGCEKAEAELIIEKKIPKLKGRP